MRLERNISVVKSMLTRALQSGNAGDIARLAGLLLQLQAEYITELQKLAVRKKVA